MSQYWLASSTASIGNYVNRPYMFGVYDMNNGHISRIQS